VGGDVLRTFSIAMLWGLIVGTFSSIYVGMPILLYFNLRTGKDEDGEGNAEPASP
jgi:preprotein translocase subunit SecF